ncbi:zinc-finger domain-containing protein [Orrella marina]|uniref:Zinc-finger domain-containing protein n=1 Tax=Orrella marina TaxID=2163011 RepID=A0A2R4XNV3_9BURK|nr:zinc-finger domain-containing protein [Orrella marina]
MTQTASAPENNGKDQNDEAGQTDLSAQSVTITSEDLPLHCPSDKAPLWSMHPRVYLDIADTGSVKCPYCGTVYQLAPGTKIHGHGH